jgi:phosphoglycolate phosphatase-like HAD superfamily hydrolase
VTGAKAALIELRQMEIELVVISGMPQLLLGKFSNEYDFQFKDHELISTIDTDDPLRQKSTGYHLQQLMKSRGWYSERLFVVGDAHSDIAMAQTQNIRTLIVLTGFLTEETAYKNGAYKVLSSVAGLPAQMRLEA